MKSGVYQILNTLTDERYIGSSVNVATRLRRHKSDIRRGVHANAHLMNAFNKYGFDVFVFEQIESCEVEIVIEREQHYIDLHAGKLYNKTNRAANPSLGYKHSAEFCKKVSEIQRQKKKNLINKKCEHCGADYQVWPHREHARFCSPECYHTFAKNKETTKRSEYVETACNSCKRPLTVRRYLVDIGKGKFCSHQCYWESKKKTDTN